MRNAKRQTMKVILLDELGAELPGVHEVHHEGPAGFSVKGKTRSFWWGDEGKTWKRAEASK